MSSVSGIGGMDAELLKSVWQMTKQNQTSEADRAQQARPGGGAPPVQQMWEGIETSAQSAGLDEEEIDSLRSALKEAISSAMESVDQSQGPGAAHEAVDSAILSTLQDYGIDTTEIESHMEEARSRMQNMPPPGQGPAGGAPRGGGMAPSGSTSSQDQASSILSMIFPLIDEEA